jgi:hypothetical protein
MCDCKFHAFGHRFSRTCDVGPLKDSLLLYGHYSYRRSQDIDNRMRDQRMEALGFPNRNCIIQIACFDPAKGIPDVLASYARLRRRHIGYLNPKNTPQLVIAGHGAVDDPGASRIFAQAIEFPETRSSDVRSDIVVMRLGPTDQMLNTLMSNVKVALRLSTHEGFEVKVSEAPAQGNSPSSPRSLEESRCTARVASPSTLAIVSLWLLI